MARVTVEDCLQKIPSRFSLVHVAAQRARQLLKGAPQLVDSENRVVVVALREIATGDVYIAGERDEAAKEKTAKPSAAAKKDSKEAVVATEDKSSDK